MDKPLTPWLSYLGEFNQCHMEETEKELAACIEREKEDLQDIIANTPESLLPLIKTIF